jgi:hypothetical protein
MFQDIGKTLAGKQELLERNTHTGYKAQCVVKEFLQENYPEIIPLVSITYQSDSRTVSIVSSRKAVVGTLLLHTKDIRASLAAAHIAIGKIIVR